MDSEVKGGIVYSFDKVVTLAELEQKHIVTAMHHAGGNKTNAAKMLGVSLKTLYNKLDEYSGKTPKKERKKREPKIAKTEGA